MRTRNIILIKFKLIYQYVLDKNIISIAYIKNKKNKNINYIKKEFCHNILNIN